MSTSKYIIGSLLLTSVLAGCSRDEHFDVKGNPEVKFFTNNTGPGNAPENSILFTVVNRPAPSGTEMINISSNFSDAVKFPVYATRAVSENVVITAEMDNSLIAGYNAANNTEFEAFPSGFFNPGTLSASISRGANISGDSITIPTNLPGVTLLTGKAYMAPVKLTAVSNAEAGSLSGNPGSLVTYIVVFPEIRKINYNAVEADALGSLIADRSAWQVSFNPAPSTTGSVTDGNNNTFTRWDVSNAEATLNMQEQKNVTGLRLRTSTSSTTTPTQIEILVSNDGVNYETVGAPLRANLTYTSQYTYIVFYSPIQAQFIRLQLTYSTSTNTQNRRLVEWDVYAN